MRTADCGKLGVSRRSQGSDAGEMVGYAMGVRMTTDLVWEALMKRLPPSALHQGCFITPIAALSIVRMPIKPD
jgi:hypothetical protein